MLFNNANFALSFQRTQKHCYPSAALSHHFIFFGLPAIYNHNHDYNQATDTHESAFAEFEKKAASQKLHELDAQVLFYCMLTTPFHCPKNLHPRSSGKVF